MGHLSFLHIYNQWFSENITHCQRIECNDKHIYGRGCGIESHMSINIFNKKCNFKQIIENIGNLIILEKLFELLELDNKLTMTKNSFTKKDKYDYFLSGDVKDNPQHFYKTNNCYIKYNKDLRQIFGVSEWFKNAKDMLCNIKPLICASIEFGKKVLTNYEKVRNVLHKCKKIYFDKHRYGEKHEKNKSNSWSDSD